MKAIGVLVLFTQLLYCVNGSEYVYYKEVDVAYKLYTPSRNWGNAYFFCKNEGASLAMPQNEQEVAAIKNLMQRYPTKLLGTDSAHIGLHDIYVEGEYTYANEQPMQSGYFNWKLIESTTYNCHAFRRTGTVASTTCANNLPFICEKRNATKDHEVLMNNGITDYRNDYIDFPHVGKSYKFHINSRTWGLARTICMSEGGHLATIDSLEEENILRTMFNEPKYNLSGVPEKRFAFVGFHDLFLEGSFITVKGERFDTAKYWNWNHAVFYGTSSYNCGAFDRTTGTVTDYLCNSLTVFFCERPLANRPMDMTTVSFPTTEPTRIEYTSIVS